MSELDRAIHVTTEWLLNHGFVQYTSPEDTGIHDIPFRNNDDLHFVEKVFDRNMFVVVFSPSLEHDDHLHHQIYVQEDAGCGFTCIPERWWFLPIEYLQSIYYGIRGEYLKPIK
jgi:hypothetical protein